MRKRKNKREEGSGDIKDQRDIYEGDHAAIVVEALGLRSEVFTRIAAALQIAMAAFESTWLSAVHKSSRASCELGPTCIGAVPYTAPNRPCMCENAVLARGLDRIETTSTIRRHSGSSICPHSPVVFQDVRYVNWWRMAVLRRRFLGSSLGLRTPATSNSECFLCFTSPANHNGHRIRKYTTVVVSPTAEESCSQSLSNACGS